MGNIGRMLFFIIAMMTVSFVNAESPKAFLLSSKDRIVFFGDSLTEMGNDPGGYVVTVRDTLQAKYPGIGVVGAGISGDRVADLLNRVDTDVLAQKPTVVVVYIGTNDVWSHNRRFGRVSVESFGADLNTLIDRLQMSGAKVMVATLAVIGEKVPPSNPLDPLIESFSEVIRTVARNRSLVLIDLRARFSAEVGLKNQHSKESGFFTTDGVHFNQAGNDLVAAEMLRVLGVVSE